MIDAALHPGGTNINAMAFTLPAARNGGENEEPDQ